MNNETKILLVDDEPDFLDIMSEFIADEGYAVKTATNGEDALALLAAEPFNLLISDINMPGMKGYELLHRAGQLYPSLKRILITAYDVRDYINYAKNYSIGNIMAKTAPFNFDEIRILIGNILTGSIFGLERYVKGRIHASFIRSSSDLERIPAEVVQFMTDQTHKRKFRQAMSEIAINAFFYGARDERGDQKHLWKFDARLCSDQEILVSWGRDNEKSGVAVTDQKGRLKKDDILYWLERNMTKDENGLSLGLKDTHGKGLYISREVLDRMIINIDPGKRAEIVMLNYSEGLYDGHRPLWIQEL